MNKEIKDVLLKMAAELENLRANQAVLSRYVAARPTIADAREAKGLALQEDAEFFDNLRKQIEGLP